MCNVCCYATEGRRLRAELLLEASGRQHHRLRSPSFCDTALLFGLTLPIGSIACVSSCRASLVLPVVPLLNGPGHIDVQPLDDTVFLRSLTLEVLDDRVRRLRPCHHEPAPSHRAGLACRG